MIWNDRMRKLREDSDLTLQEVADRLGVTVSTAQRYEKPDGIKAVPYEIIVKYANIFGVTPSYIMGWDDEMNYRRQDYSYRHDKLRDYLLDLTDNDQDRAITLLKAFAIDRYKSQLEDIINSKPEKKRIFFELWEHVNYARDEIEYIDKYHH